MEIKCVRNRCLCCSDYISEGLNSNRVSLDKLATVYRCRQNNSRKV